MGVGGRRENGGRRAAPAGRGRKMMKRVLFVLLTLFICGSVVSAHSGQTDAQGGHWDSTGGGYHYHHGYPAHSHINGECPYNFDDRTGWNSGESGSSGGGYSYGKSYDNGSLSVEQVKELQEHYGVTVDGKWGRKSSAAAGGLTADEAWKEVFEKETTSYFKVPFSKVEPEDEPEEEQPDKENDSIFPYVFLCFSFLAPFAVLIVWAIIDRAKRIKDKLVDEPKRKKEEAEERQRREIQLENERTEFMSNYGGKRLDEIAPPPTKGDHIGEDGLPCGAGNGPWGRYTVYVTPHGKAFHTKKVCGATCGQAVNLATVRYIKQPCSRCGRSAPDLRWYDEQKRLRNESKRLFGESVFEDEDKHEGKAKPDFLPEVPKTEMWPGKFADAILWFVLSMLIVIVGSLLDALLTL